MIDEQLLRQRLEAAVADIHPPSRLDEIVAQPPRRSPWRGQRLLAVAALVLVLAAVVAVVAVVADRDEAVVTDQPPTTTTTTATPRPTVGDAVQVPVELLPDGFVLVSETDAEAPIADDRWPYTVLVFAESEASYQAGEPAIRVALLPLRSWVESMRSSIETLSGERPGPGEIMRIDAPWRPNGTDALLGTDGEWVRYGRPSSYDVLLLVDGRQIDDQTLEAIVAQAAPST